MSTVTLRQRSKRASLRVQALAPIRDLVLRLIALLDGRRGKRRSKEPNTPPPGIVLLTEREHQLIRAACDPAELTYAAIAADMGIHPRTLDAHRRKVFKNLQVKSRAGLVRVAMEWGLA